MKYAGTYRSVVHIDKVVIGMIFTKQQSEASLLLLSFVLFESGNCNVIKLQHKSVAISQILFEMNFTDKSIFVQLYSLCPRAFFGDIRLKLLPRKSFVSSLHSQ